MDGSGWFVELIYLQCTRPKPLPVAIVKCLLDLTEGSTQNLRLKLADSELNAVEVFGINLPNLPWL